MLGDLLMLPGVYGNLVPDAHLAALAIEHGVALCSTDGNFARFPGLTWLNPLSREWLGFVGRRAASHQGDVVGAQGRN